MQKNRSETKSTLFWHEEITPFIFGSSFSVEEVKSVFGHRFDFSIRGIEILQSPCEVCNVLVICGQITHKLLPYLLDIEKRMHQKKWVMWIECQKDEKKKKSYYSGIPNLEKYISIDVFVPGNTPSSEEIMDGFLQVQDIIKNGK